MAQEIDDFFMKKIENIQDTLPENTTFDESLLWANMQQDLRKPKRFAWYWVSAAACLLVIGSLFLFDSNKIPNKPTAIVKEKTTTKEIEKKPVVKRFSSKKNEHKSKQTISLPTQKLDFQVESIASKSIDFSEKEMQNMPDSITFKSNIVFEKKPKMNIKIVHINEISKYEDAPFKQPRFKVQFAGTLFEKTESINNEIIKIPSIRTQ